MLQKAYDYLNTSDKISGRAAQVSSFVALVLSPNHIDFVACAQQPIHCII